MKRLAFVALAFSLLACDQVERVFNKREQEGTAIGYSCRQSGRSLEDCYQRHPTYAKAYILSGWLKMDQYMREKKIAVIPPPPVRKSAHASPAPASQSQTAPPALSSPPPAPTGDAQKSAKPEQR